MQVVNTLPLVEPFFFDSYADQVKEQVQTGFVGVGKKTEEFAKALANFVNAPYSLLTVSGTIALSVAAIALGLRPGDEILVPAYGVISTINAFTSIGLKPKLVEIDCATGCIFPDHLAHAISKKTRAVCFVNFTGYTGPNLCAIKDICAENNVPLIEDAACALGHAYQGVYSGLFGTIGIYSFSVPKILTTGQGGAIITKDEEIYKRAAAYIDHGDLNWRKTGINYGIGSNLRFNDTLSALGYAQLQNIDTILKRKKDVFDILKSAFGTKIFTVPGDKAPLHNIVFPKDPINFMEKLKKRGISTSRGYKTLSMHPIYQELALVKCLASDFWTNHAVFLPFGLALSQEDAAYIAQTVKELEYEMLDIGIE